MKRYIRATSERTTITVRCIDHEYGKYTLKDDVGNIYVYDRGAFPSSKFSDDLRNIIRGEYGGINSNVIITISARITPRAGRDCMFNLVSPRIISVG